MSTQKAAGTKGRAGGVFAVFLKLGLTSFGGPIAHIGYFRNELVQRRKWLDEVAFADLLALCQFLPGPASSQLGFALGLSRGGALGALAAWCGFTLPSAILLVLFALGAPSLQGPLGDGVLHGLKLVAVAVIGQAVWGMARTLAPDRPRAGIAVAAVVLIAFAPGSVAQIAALVIGAAGGLLLCRDGEGGPVGALPLTVSRRAGGAALAVFAILLVGLPVLAELTRAHGAALAAAFYRSGALVFGGGHVVLPLLRAEVVAPGWISESGFLAGYGAAQAVPGPLFTFGAYLGAAMHPGPNGVAGAALCLVAIFVPGMLLLVGALPFWDALRTRPRARAAMRGTNAAVVGILAAALYDPVWVSAVLSPTDFAAALVGFALLTVWKVPPVVVVALLAAAGAALVAL